MDSSNNAELQHAIETLTGEIRALRAEEISRQKFAKFGALGSDKTIDFWYAACIRVQFYLPKALIDIVQTHILMTETFWDQSTLEAFSPYIRGKDILDVGANIGSHSVFWGRISGAKSITAFEPMPETFAILKRNIELNRLSRIVKLHAVGLGEREASGDPWSEAHNRMHAIVRARDDRAGAIRIRPLDGLNLAPFDFAKIDVEGHTALLLKGAQRTLERLKPTLYVELWVSERPSAKQILDAYGYDVLGSVEDSNYLFVHRSRPDEVRALQSIVTGPWQG